MSGVTAMMTLVLIGAIAGYEAAVIPPIAYIIIAIFWAYVLTRQSEKEENINAAE